MSKRVRRRVGPSIPPNLLSDMPVPLAPVFVGGAMYCCNKHGLHVPLEALSVSEMRLARCYLDIENYIAYQ